MNICPLEAKLFQVDRGTDNLSENYSSFSNLCEHA